MIQESNQSFDYEDDAPMIKPATNLKINNTKKSKARNADLENNLGIYNDIKIESYEAGKQKGKLLKLISYDSDKNKFEIDLQTLAIFQKYAEYQIGFISAVGERGNGKSYILDKILNLAGVKGNHFSSNVDKGIFIWSQPFRKRNMKLFLVDSEGFKYENMEFQVKKMQILYFFSSTILFNNKSKSGYDDLHYINELIKQCRQNFLYDDLKVKKESKILSSSLYHLYRVAQSKGINNELSTFFTDYNFTYLEDALNPNYKGKPTDLIECSFLTTSCVSQKFIRHISEIFKSIYTNIEEKSVDGISYNGNIVYKLILNLISTINKKKVIDINKLFINIKTELYTSAYNYCIILYSESLENDLDDQQPKNLDRLIDIFSKSSSQTLEKFNEFNLDPKFHQEYLSKLQQHISMKQNLILEINKKKTLYVLETQFNYKISKNSDDCLNLIKSFESFKPQLDHGREQFFMQLLQKIFGNVEQNQLNHEFIKQMDNQQKQIKQLEHQLNKRNQNFKIISSEFNSMSKLLSEQAPKNKTIQQRLKKFKKEVEQIDQQVVNAINNSHVGQSNDKYQKTIKENKQKIAELTKVFNTPVVSKKVEPPKNNQKQQLKKKEQELKSNLARVDEEIGKVKQQISGKSERKK